MWRLCRIFEVLEKPTFFEKVGFWPNRDLKHFAESADIPEEKEEEAARHAGFEAANRIGTYLRTLIHQHHDTLAVAVN